MAWQGGHRMPAGNAGPGHHVGTSNMRLNPHAFTLGERIQTWQEGQIFAGGAEAPQFVSARDIDVGDNAPLRGLNGRLPYRLVRDMQPDLKSARPAMFKQDEEWQQWAEVKIRLTPLPADMTTLELYSIFSLYGTVVKVDMDKKRSAAYISFSPPPKIGFWEMPQAIRSPTGARLCMKAELLRPLREFYHVSPVDKDVRYPERMRLDATSLAFGLMYDESTMMIMDEAVPEGQSLNMTLNLLETRQQLEIRFSLPSPGTENNLRATNDHYRFHIPLHKIERIHEMVTRNRRALVIPVEIPPEFYKQTHDIESTHDENTPVWTDWRTWFRQTDIPEDRLELRQRPVGFKTLGSWIDIAGWTTYFIEFNNLKEKERALYDLIRRALTDYNIQVVSTAISPIGFCDAKDPEVWNLLDVSAKVDHANSLAALSDMAASVYLGFPVRYQLEVCMSHGHINEYNITEDFLRTLAATPEPRALGLLERVADMKSRVYRPMDIFNLQVSRKTQVRNIPRSCVITRAATVTPSTVHFSTPQVEVSNRVLRRFEKFSDRFLRVKFSDEGNRGRIKSTDDETANAVFERIKRTLRNGIVLGERKYEFLAFGSSQFREHGAYFCAAFHDGERDWTASDIRDWLGDMRSIKSVSKLCSRIGLSFSTTRAINLHTTPEVQTMEDISRNGFTFTDGVGKISLSLARIIGTEFGMPNSLVDPPSLYQFRMGGCKGVLAIDPMLKGTTVCIRESQYKFPARLNGLEVIRVSQFAAATTNRQLITILSSLKVKDDVFIQKLRLHLAELEGAMVNKATAIEHLTKNIDLNQSTLVMAGIIRNGFMDAQDPFIMTMLHLWRVWNMKYIKEKAKIFIEKGAFLFGCVDELGVLRGHFNADQKNEYASREAKESRLPEIFLRVDPEKNGNYKVITSVCILARNPSLHPGDIRVVRAVDRPELHHLNNVVVLPQTGDQDLASMCSGGDLDGDDYIVIWDPDLIPAVEDWNHEPMDFTPEKPRLTEKKITADDIIDFFVTYMKNDKLPAIAHAHLAWADYLAAVGGVKEEKCIELAKLHSQAVDYPKSGVPARIPRHLHPRMWPHFMEKNKPAQQTYHSDTILGQIYDKVQIEKFKPRYELPFDPRVLNAYTLKPEHLGKAAEIKEEYDSAIRRIMAQHAIGTEFEVFSTFVLAHNFEKKDYNFAEELGHTISMLKDRFRKMCIEEAGGSDYEILGPFVAAMYAITAMQIRDALHECTQTRRLRNGREVPLRRLEPKDMPLLSFPWIFERVLGRIANGGVEIDDVRVKQGGRKKLKMAPAQAEASADAVVETAQGPVHQDEDLILFASSSKSSANDAAAGAENDKAKARDEAPQDAEVDTVQEKVAEPEVDNAYDAETAFLFAQQREAHIAMVESGIQGRDPGAAIASALSRKRTLFDPHASRAEEWAPGATVQVPASESGASARSGDGEERGLVADASEDGYEGMQELDLDELRLEDMQELDLDELQLERMRELELDELRPEDMQELDLDELQPKGMQELDLDELRLDDMQVLDLDELGHDPGPGINGAGAGFGVLDPLHANEEPEGWAAFLRELDQHRDPYAEFADPDERASADEPLRLGEEEQAATGRYEVLG